MNHPSDHARPVSLVRIFGWALALRLIASGLVQWYAQRKGVLCLFPDTDVYWGLAGKILRREPYEVLDWGDLPRFALRTPGYPLFLAACRWEFGARVFPVRIVQAVLGAVCVAVVARLTRRTVGDAPVRPGTSWTLPMVAAAITALDPWVVANSAFILSEALFLPLMLVAQWGFAEVWSVESKPRWFWAVLAGAMTGASVLVRPSWSLYPPLILAALAVSGRWRPALIAAVAVAAVMTPWWVRNASIYGRFVPTALWSGASLYDGLNPNATGASDMRFLADPEFWPLDEEAQDAALLGKALQFARERPGRVAMLAVIKAGRFWSPWPNAETFRSVPLAVAGSVVSLPLFGLLAVGLWDRRRDFRTLVLLASPLAYTFALHLVFVSSMRYRVPVEVPAAGLMAIGLQRLLAGRAVPER